MRLEKVKKHLTCCAVLPYGGVRMLYSNCWCDPAIIFLQKKSVLYWKMFREKSICNDFSSVKKQIEIWILLLCKFYSILLSKQTWNT